MNGTNSCVFCRIAAHDASASFVYEDDTVCAFLDIQPVTEGHLLVVPKQHAEGLGELPLETARHLMEVARLLADGLRASPVDCEGINLFLADGAAAGQEVDHVHLHVIPRTRGDGFGLRLPEGYGARPPREQLDRVAATVRDGLTHVEPLMDS